MPAQTTRRTIEEDRGAPAGKPPAKPKASTNSGPKTAPPAANPSRVHQVDGDFLVVPRGLPVQPQPVKTSSLPLKSGSIQGKNLGGAAIKDLVLRTMDTPEQAAAFLYKDAARQQADDDDVKRRWDRLTKDGDPWWDYRAGERPYFSLDEDEATHRTQLLDLLYDIEEGYGVRLPFRRSLGLYSTAEIDVRALQWTSGWVSSVEQQELRNIIAGIPPLPDHYPVDWSKVLSIPDVDWSTVLSNPETWSDASTATGIAALGLAIIGIPTMFFFPPAGAALLGGAAWMGRVSAVTGTAAVIAEAAEGDFEEAGEDALIQLAGLLIPIGLNAFSRYAVTAMGDSIAGLAENAELTNQTLQITEGVNNWLGGFLTEVLSAGTDIHDR